MKQRAQPAARPGTRALAQCSDGPGTRGLFATVAACAVHAGLLGGALYLANPSPSQASKPPPQALLEVELPVAMPEPEPVEPEPEPEIPEPPPEPKRAAKPPPVRVVQKAPVEPPPEPEKPAEPEPPAPAAAQAAEAITAKDDAPQAAAENTLVTGQGSGYAGGTTERGGTAKQAVASTAARAFGVEGGTGTAQPDRSRPPQLASGTRWDCPLPEEALDEGVEHAVVGLLVEVGPDGKLVSVAVKSDPGYGFAREARSCALKKRWLPALDRNGQPLRKAQLVNVRF